MKINENDLYQKLIHCSTYCFNVCKHIKYIILHFFDFFFIYMVGDILRQASFITMQIHFGYTLSNPCCKKLSKLLSSRALDVL